MPKLKKQAKNAYFYFIMEQKKQREAEGYHIGNFLNASNTFGYLWQQMSKEDKLPYEQMAKEGKEQEKYNINNKFTVTGESYAQVNRKVQDQRTAQETMLQFIERLTSGPDAGDRNYIFMKVIYCVEEIIDKKKRVHSPSEIAMVAFSLKEGIKAIYTQMVDTVTTPTGYASQAKEFCEETMLPIPGDTNAFTDDCRDYLRILKNINGFANHWLKTGYDVPGHRRVFFALDKETQPIMTSLQWLFNQIDDKEKPKYQRILNSLKVYSLPKLILAMAQEANRVNPEYINYLVEYKLDTAAEAIITKGNYDYREEIACYYHRTDGGMKMHNCAQSIVMRRVFMLFEEFLSGYKFPKVERHRIEKLSNKKLRRPVLKKKREESPKETDVVSEPAWMKDDDFSFPSTTSPTPMEADSSNVSSWGQRPAPSASFEDDDFPTLGGSAGSSQGKPAWMSGSQSARSPHSPPPSMPGAGGGRGRGYGGGGSGFAAKAAAPGPPKSFMDDDSDNDEYPSLSASSGGRGRGRGGGGY